MPPKIDNIVWDTPHPNEITWDAAPTETTTPPAQPYQRQPVDALDAAFREESPYSYRAMQQPKEALKEAKEAAATVIETGAQIGGSLGGAALAAPSAVFTGPVGPFAGGVAGGISGYTAARQLTGKLGLREEEPVLTSAGTGLLYEVGGRAVGKVLEKGIGAGSKIVEKVTGKGPAKAATVGELKQAETQAWDKVANSTTTFKDPVPLKDSVNKLLSDKGFNYRPNTFPSLNEPLKELNSIYEATLQGTPANIHDMRTVRTLLQDLRMSGGAKPREKELAGKIMDELDKYVLDHGGADAAAWKEARDVSNQLFRHRDVQELVESAEKSSKATSQQIRSQFKDILSSNQIKMYSPEQQAIIKQIADGTATEKTLEFIGKMAPKSPSWGALFAMLNTATGFAGVGARSAANALAKSRVNMLDELIRGGQMPQTIQLPQTTQRLFPAGVNVLANQLQGQQ